MEERCNGRESEDKLIADSRDEVLVMRNGEDGAVELLQGGGKGVERLVVQVVGRLVKSDQVRLVPHCGREHQPASLSS
eukprot:765591-Hanusia_phi.AAC.2